MAFDSGGGPIKMSLKGHSCDPNAPFPIAPYNSPIALILASTTEPEKE